MTTPIERIRAELSLTRAWKILDLPGEPVLNRDLHSPFREDKKPSFRLYEGTGHIRWHDHGTGDKGDVVDLWAMAKGLSVPEAVQDILQYLDGGQRTSYRYKKPETVKTEAPQAPENGFRVPPDMRIPSEDECRALSVLRPGILPGAFDLASKLGTLRIATIYKELCWIITDPTGICAEARRLDGKKFLIKGEEEKSFCLPGSRKIYPIGLRTNRAEFDALRNIILVEGQPDYFAALSIAIDSDVNFRPAAMLGVSLSLKPQAREYFRGASVLIIPHNDKTGKAEAAAQRWSGELKAFGASKIFIQRLPIVCDDLADYLQQNPEAPTDALLQSFNHGKRERSECTTG